MARQRGSIFDSAEDLDLSGFTPKAAPDPDPISPDHVRAVAEASQFQSREPARRRPAEAPATPPKRSPRRHRTGRTAQFNARTTQGTVDAFYAIADRQGWLVGETLEHALAALQRELEGQGRC